MDTQHISPVSLSGNEKIELISNLSTMLGAGIPILDAVNSMMEDSKGNVKRILETIKNDLMQGKRGAASLAHFPRSFVVPKISMVFSRLRVELPLPTRIMVFMSDILIRQTWALIIGSVAGILLFIIFFRRKRQLVLEVFFSLPLVSGLIKMVDLTRFSRSMYLLLSSGLPIITALELTRDVVFKSKTSRIIAHSRELVMSGKRLSEGFRLAGGYFPSILVKLIESGEKSGTLDKAMKDISEYLDYQVSNILKAFTAILEPVMLVIVGICVGGMMLAIIAPIYGLIGQVGGR